MGRAEGSGRRHELARHFGAALVVFNLVAILSAVVMLSLRNVLPLITTEQLEVVQSAAALTPLVALYSSVVVFWTCTFVSILEPHSMNSSFLGVF